MALKFTSSLLNKDQQLIFGVRKCSDANQVKY